MPKVPSYLVPLLPDTISPRAEDLVASLTQYMPARAIADAQRGIQFATAAHSGQLRKSGEPFIVHPIATAHYLAGLRVDIATVLAGLLHDTLEDTDVTYEDIEREFGHAVARMVEGVTKFNVIGMRSRQWLRDAAVDAEDHGDLSKTQVENTRRMLLSMAEDPRVVIVKLADRLHNMRTLDHQPAERQQHIALETREIYAPLAGRLGVYEIKSPLEDLAFQYLEPEAYLWLVNHVEERQEEGRKHVDEVIDRLQLELQAHGIEASLSGRVKSLYSLYTKLQRPENEFDLGRIGDIYAVRVIVNTVSECYQALGLSHGLWLPVPGRVRDYISVPKSNGYRSLHTTVSTGTSRTAEIQIRTHEMHETAEYGVATHWYYKEQGGSTSIPLPLSSWIQALTAWQQELNSDAAEFVDTLKTDMFTGQVFVFSPQGDIIDLPSESTPVDFAYKIHTELGHRTIGTKINGLFMPLDTTLNTGDRVEIVTSKTARGPDLDWLSFVRSASTRHKIRRWFRQQDREINIERGRTLLDSRLQKLGHPPAAEQDMGTLWKVAHALGLKSVEDLFAHLGNGALTVHAILNQLGVVTQGAREPQSILPGRSPLSIRALGVGDLLTRLASDCHPVPGDEVIGYITRNRGITVHRVDCPRIRTEKELERLIPVNWGQHVKKRLYAVVVEIEAWDRAGLLRDIAMAVSMERVSMASAAAETNPDGRATLTVTLRISSIDQLSRIFTRIERIKGVLDVRRRQRSGKS